MGIGHKAIRSLIDTGAKNNFRKLQADWFLEDEEEAYQFLEVHFRRHGQLPDNKTFKENGIALPKADQPFSYYLQRIQDRAVFNGINEYQPELIKAMKRRDIPTAIETLGLMYKAGKVITNTNDHSTILEEARLIEEDYYEAKINPGVQGITTGQAPLDDATDGLHGGELLVIAGRPNIGKSYKLLKCAHEAWHQGYSPLVVSMEMGSKNLARRMIAMKSGLNPDFIRKGQLSSLRGEDKFLDTIDALEDMPPIHFLRGNFKKNTGDIDNAIQELSPDLVYVDAAYELKPEGSGKGKARWEQIAEVFQELKATAENRSIPMVATVQISKEGEKKSRGKNKRPSLANIAGADAIAQIADMVVMMYNGITPREVVTRDCFLVKNREGDNNLRYQMNFRFSPMNFNYIIGSACAADQEPTESDEEVTDREEAGYEI